MPGWQVSSSGFELQILSDRVILTPPYPGKTRGGLWTEKAVDTETWSAEVAFRASGQESGTGNLNIWFAKDKAPIFLDSLYTVGSFDGLILTIDQYGGHGSIRGFLNDGTQDFRSHSSLESLAFGHCNYAYRNLGRPSTLKITSHDGLTVSVDDQLCFSSPHISLPSSYYFGVTASTSDNPDSFEIKKFAVTTGIPHTHDNVLKGMPAQARSPESSNAPLQKLDRFPGSPEAVPDTIPDDIKSSEAQFADLHNRLQGLTHQVANIFSEFEQLGRKMEERHLQIMAGMPSIPHDKLDGLGRRLEGLERNIDQVRRDVEGRDYKDRLDTLNHAIESVKSGMTESLPESIGSSKCPSSTNLLEYPLTYHYSDARLFTTHRHFCVHCLRRTDHVCWSIHSLQTAAGEYAQEIFVKSCICIASIPTA